MFIVGCSHPTVDKYTERREVMGTFIQLDICENQVSSVIRDKAYQDIWMRLDEINERMSSYRATSEVSQVNMSYVVDGHPLNGKSSPVSVSPDTYEVLKRSKYFNEITDGAFDITVWKLMNLWRQKAKANEMPLPSEIEEIQKYRGMNFLKFLPDYQIENTGLYTQVDLGAIAKGYAVDEVARIFRKYGINNFYIDAGGDVYVGGLNCENKLWRIGIRDPRDRSQLMDVILLTNSAVTTSGNYEQFLDIQGRRFSHIINPKTGYPQENVVSATVITGNAADADALSTALTVLGADKGIKLIESLDGDFEALVMTQDVNGNNFQLKSSKNYQKFKSDNKK